MLAAQNEFIRARTNLTLCPGSDRKKVEMESERAVARHGKGALCSRKFDEGKRIPSFPPSRFCAILLRVIGHPARSRAEGFTMYRLCFACAVIVVPGLWVVGSYAECNYLLHSFDLSTVRILPSEFLALIAVAILIGAPILHWITALRQERLARRSHQEVLAAIDRLADEMAAAQAAQIELARLQILDLAPIEDRPNPTPKKRGGRPRKYNDDVFLKLIDASTEQSATRH